MFAVCLVHEAGGVSLGGGVAVAAAEVVCRGGGACTRHVLGHASVGRPIDAYGAS